MTLTQDFSTMFRAGTSAFYEGDVVRVVDEDLEKNTRTLMPVALTAKWGPRIVSVTALDALPMPLLPIPVDNPKFDSIPYKVGAPALYEGARVTVEEMQGVWRVVARFPDDPELWHVMPNGKKILNREKILVDRLKPANTLFDDEQTATQDDAMSEFQTGATVLAHGYQKGHVIKTGDDQQVYVEMKVGGRQWVAVGDLKLVAPPSNMPLLPSWIKIGIRAQSDVQQEGEITAINWTPKTNRWLMTFKTETGIEDLTVDEISPLDTDEGEGGHVKPDSGFVSGWTDSRDTPAETNDAAGETEQITTGDLLAAPAADDGKMQGSPFHIGDSALLYGETPVSIIDIDLKARRAQYGRWTDPALPGYTEWASFDDLTAVADEEDFDPAPTIAQQEIDRAKEIASKDAEIARLKTALAKESDALRTKVGLLANASQIMAGMKADLTDSQRALKDVQTIADHRDGQVADLQRALERANERIRTLQAQVAQPPAKCRVEIKTLIQSLGTNHTADADQEWAQHINGDWEDKDISYVSEMDGRSLLATRIVTLQREIQETAHPPQEEARESILAPADLFGGHTTTISSGTVEQPVTMIFHTDAPIMVPTMDLPEGDDEIDRLPLRQMMSRYVDLYSPEIAAKMVARAQDRQIAAKMASVRLHYNETAHRLFTPLSRHTIVMQQP